MILIADSGSTKTDWVLLDLESSKKIRLQGIGLNPYYTSREAISAEVIRLFQNSASEQISHIYFYGSGCSSDPAKKKIQQGLKTYFQDSEIQVNHDLEAAARSLCGSRAGIACILGTGSNAAYYDGENIIKSAVSLGYLLGDEGSGYALGKKLVHDVFLGIAPPPIRLDFQKEFNLSLSDLLSRVYQQENPNRFLASFAKYIAAHREETYFRDLIQNSFSEFLNLVVLPLNPDKNQAVNFTGSIAWFFKDELQKACEMNQFILGKISQKPIDDLVDYHYNKETI